jgi:GAF domain
VKLKGSYLQQESGQNPSVATRGPREASQRAMKPYSNLGRSSTLTRSAVAIEHTEDSNEESGMQPGRNGSAKATASTLLSPPKSGANVESSFKSSSLHFPGDDAAHSLANLAQRDLDAALQLLADRAQYITGAGGAAIALRRDGRNDMLCRASAGENAPELGTLLSAEFGLSGESVRSRQPLRCDDAERDPRVNREGCRQMGIASVVVMPIVHDDQVVGVFELFSGKANAFSDRDLAALKRLSEMVETAIKLVSADGSLPQAAVKNPAPGSRKPPQSSPPSDRVPQMQASGAVDVQSPKPPAAVSVPTASPAPERVKPAAPKKPLFWSAALNPVPEKDKDPSVAADRSHVPAVLRNLRKCQACGFPVSEGRILCVECEEKKWRGKLGTPAPKASPEPSMPVATPAVIAPSPDLANPQAPQLSSLLSVQRTIETSRTIGGMLDQTPVFSAGLAPSESWLSRNKYIVGAVLAIAGGIAAVVLFR